MAAILEHLNLSVRKPQEMAQTLCRLFDWQVRWEGEGIHAGYTVHVGGTQHYLALYAPPRFTTKPGVRYFSEFALNHVGVVVDDLEAVRERVEAAGLVVHNENAIVPGRRIYFMLEEVEFEVVAY
ncbi:MAG: VOC family protein [Thiolinea sp.]